MIALTITSTERGEGKTSLAIRLLEESPFNYLLVPPARMRYAIGKLTTQSNFHRVIDNVDSLRGARCHLLIKDLT